MKKIILLLLAVFVNVNLFSADYREVIFGNRWENISEITDG